MTYEGKQYKGLFGIGYKYGGLPSTKHKADIVDYHPTVADGVLAFISGEISIDGGPGIKFDQVLSIHIGGKNGYYLLNDHFKMNVS